MRSAARRALAAGVVVALAAGCDRGRPREAPRAAEPAPTPAAAAPAVGDGCHQPTPRTVYPAAARVVAIGDLHGDAAAARTVLRLAGAIDEHDAWIGGELVVVQTGDVLDRGGGEREILDLFARLGAEAKAAGGALIALDGNHELMNAAGDFSYVTDDGYAAFADLAPAGELADVPAAVRGRVAAFRPGGPYARQLAAQPVAAIVGDTVFVHGGILPDAAAHGLEAASRETACWLAGEGPMPALAGDPESLVWTRRLGFDPADCDAARAALATLGVRQMVIGHTVQEHGISSACDDTVWRIDVGLAALYGGPREVLELRGDAVKVLR